MDQKETGVLITAFRLCVLCSALSTLNIKGWHIFIECRCFVCSFVRCECCSDGII